MNPRLPAYRVWVRGHYPLIVTGLLGALLLLVLAVGTASAHERDRHDRHGHGHRSTAVQRVDTDHGSLTAIRDRDGVIRQVHATQTPVRGVANAWQVLVLDDGQVVWSQTYRTDRPRLVVRPGAAGDAVIVRVGWAPNAFPLEVTW